MISFKTKLRRFVVAAILFSICHWFLFLFSGALLAGRGLHRIDHPEFPLTAVDRFCDLLLGVLELPCEVFYDLVGLSDIGPTSTLMCSLAWGAALAVIFCCVARRVNE